VYVCFCDGARFGIGYWVGLDQKILVPVNPPEHSVLIRL
jgi:hypothetical protein